MSKFKTFNNYNALNPTTAKRGVLGALIVILIITVLEFPPPIGFETRPQSNVSVMWLIFFLVILITDISTIPLIYKCSGLGRKFAMAAAIYQKFRLSTKAFTIGIGLALGALVASLASAAFLNPAVAFSLQQWNIWTYMVGPVLGAVLGMNLYNLLFVETEVAEVAEAKAEVVEARVAAKAPVKKAAAKKPAAKKKTVAKK